MILSADSCVVFIPCDAIPCWTAPMSRHRSLFALGICFPPIQIGADVRQTATCSASWSDVSIFETDSAHTFLNSNCPWVIVSALSTFATTGYNIAHYNSSSTRRMCPSRTQLLADPEHAVGSRLMPSENVLYNHRHLHVTGSLSPHCAFDVRRISPV
jgi:hypothetical protein